MRKDVFDILRRMREDIDSFMSDRVDDFYERFPEAEGFNYPRTDIEEKDKEIVITMDIPGMDKSDIDINVEEDEIEVEARKEEEAEDKEEEYYKLERGYKGFYRKLPLPCRIEPEETKASYDNGVLTIRSKKKEDKDKGKKVDIE